MLVGLLDRVAVFRLAFEQWIAPGETRALTAVIDVTLDGMKAVAGASGR